MKHTPLSEYTTPEWEANGWTTVYQGNETIVDETWVTFVFNAPFLYDGENHVLVDFSFNNGSASFDGWCRVTETGVPRSLQARTDSMYGDPLSWHGASPTPELATQVPGIKLTPYMPPVAVEPTVSGQFVNGTWQGHIRVPTAAADVSLCCMYGTLLTHSAPFTISIDSEETVVVLRIALAGGCADDPELARVRERLAGLYGSAATLQCVEVGGEATELTLRIPASGAADAR